MIVGTDRADQVITETIAPLTGIRLQQPGHLRP